MPVLSGMPFPELRLWKIIEPEMKTLHNIFVTV